MGNEIALEAIRAIREIAMAALSNYTTHSVENNSLAKEPPAATVLLSKPSTIVETDSVSDVFDRFEHAESTPPLEQKPKVVVTETIEVAKKSKRPPLIDENLGQMLL